LVCFFKLLLSNEPFYTFLGSDSIHGSSDSLIFGKKARTRSSLKIRDSTRYYFLAPFLSTFCDCCCFFGGGYRSLQVQINRL
jgi:hypothetical protein